VPAGRRALVQDRLEFRDLGRVSLHFAPPGPLEASARRHRIADICDTRNREATSLAPPSIMSTAFSRTFSPAGRDTSRSKGMARADAAHEKVTAMGYSGSERTTRRAVR
jgi:hypothetical protein